MKKGFKFSEEYKKRLSEIRKGRKQPGKKYSEKARKEMSLYRAGEKNPMFGKHHSNETKEKIIQGIKNYYFQNKNSESEKIMKQRIGIFNKGKKLSEEHKNKIGLSHLGKEVSEETRKRLSEINTGKKLSEETKDKISVALKGRISNRKGIKMSEEQKQKIRKSMIGKFKERRKFIVVPRNDTKIEIKIQNYLKDLNIEFFTHQYIDIEHGYQCDIFIPILKLVIECDGDYWHKYPIGLDLDKVRTQELIEKGFKVLRLWESEIKVMSSEEFKEKITRYTE